MKFNKFLACILAIIVGICAPIQVFAADSHSMVVNYGMNESFTVVIPPSFDIDMSGKSDVSISASNVLISDDTTLTVVISGADYAGNWELIDITENSNRLIYNIGTTEGGNDIVNGSVVLSVAAGEAYNSTVEEVLYFSIAEDIVKAGTYQDTLTFTVSVD